MESVCALVCADLIIEISVPQNIYLDFVEWVS